MALVDYAASSDEEVDSDEEQKEAVIVRGTQPTPNKLESENLSGNTSKHNDNSVFLSLPKPSVNPLLLMDDNTLSKLLLNNKQGLGKGRKNETVKITVPSMSDFKDDEEQPKSKKPKVESKNSGLFSVLPPPKNMGVTQANTTFVPHTVSAKKNRKSINIDKYLKKPENKQLKSTELNEAEDDEEVGSSFFGSFLTETSKSSEMDDNSGNVCSETDLVPVYKNENLVSPTVQNVPNQSYEGTSGYQYAEENLNAPDTTYQPIEDETEESLGLDEKALQILCGGKKKRQQMPMNIIDLSGEEIMPDSKEWLLKQFTEGKKVRGHSHRKTNGPSTQQRRKHQITYLAYQAKEQELELQNQWANNRMSRRQTQSKYGF